jgi:hypothetical protein
MAQKSTLYICLTANIAADVEIPAEGAITMYIEDQGGGVLALAGRTSDAEFHYFKVGGVAVLMV